MIKIVLTIALLTSLNALGAEKDVEIECTLSFTQSASIDKISLFSATDEVKILYRNGAEEVAKPVEALDGGIFGTEDFSADVVGTNGQVYVPDTAAGDIYIQYRCFLTPDIFFERCTSQGTKEPAEFSGVRMNIDGKALAFFNQNICKRTDRTAR